MILRLPPTELVVVGRAKWKMPIPVLKNAHDPFGGERLDPNGLDITVLRSIGHDDDQLSGICLDGMLSSI